MQEQQPKQNNNILDNQNKNGVDRDDKSSKGKSKQKETIVQLSSVSFGYEPHSTSPLSLSDISFKVFEGDILGIIGPNGAGKTTLFQCMLGLQHRYSGNVLLFNQDIRKNKGPLKKIGYVPQNKSINQEFPATVKEIVSFGIVESKKGIFHFKFQNNFSIGRAINSHDKDTIENKIDKSIEAVGMSKLKDKRIGQLSGGELQRVLIAKALVNNPKLLILDEPTTGIDENSKIKFYDLLQKLNKDYNLSIIWSSHDLDAVSKFANKVVCINRRMCFHGSTQDFFQNNDLFINTFLHGSNNNSHVHLHFK